MKDKLINIEPKTKEDYESILREQFGPSWERRASEIAMLMDYKQYVGDLKGHFYSEIVDAVWEL